MGSSLERHQNIHLNNPDVNYIRLENCEYCKYEKRKNYRNRYRTNTVYNIPPIMTRQYNPYEYTYYNIPEYQPPETCISLKKVNESSKLELNPDDSFCPICQDKIKKWDIVRKLSCGHKFHQKCCDKWLETNAACPMCRQEL